jgi:hypothetical protein
MSIDIQEKDVGTQVEITPKKPDGSNDDISGGTKYEIHFRKPDASTLVKTATIEGTGSASDPYRWRYVGVADVFTPAGMWGAQGYVEFTSGATKYKTRIVQFHVGRNIVA